MNGHLEGWISPYINGQFLSPSQTEYLVRLQNPVQPSDILAHTGWQKSHVLAVTDGLGKAFLAFQKFSLASRLEMLQKLLHALNESADELKSQMMLELGRCRKSVDDEWAACQQLFSILPEYMENMMIPRGDRRSWEWRYFPLGPVLISSNISLPVFSLLSAVLPTLLAGNVVCLKPSPYCVLSGSLLAHCFHQAGFPPGVVQFLYGDLQLFRSLLMTKSFHAALYSGGDESLEQLKRDSSQQQDLLLSLNSAGKNPAYIDETASLKRSVEKVVMGCCLDTGQRMEATNLLFVHQHVYVEFLDALVSDIKKFPIVTQTERTNPYGSVAMGPLCSVDSHERVLRFQGIAARECDETFRWGKAIDNPGDGYFVSPGIHLLDKRKVLQSVYAKNAFFGPDLCVVVVDHKEEAVDLINKMNVAKCVGIFSREEKCLNYFQESCRVPALFWNESTTEINPAVPTIGHGNAGNSLHTGLYFVRETVYPKSVQRKKGEG